MYNKRYLFSDRSTLRSKLAIWATKFKINNIATDSLLKILNIYEPDMPLTAKTLLATPRNIQVQTLDPSTEAEVYYYPVSTTIQQNLMRYSDEQLSNYETINLVINYDGLPASKSSTSVVWPFLASFMDLYPRIVFPLNLYMGKTKPASLDYLIKTIDELRELETKGIIIYGECKLIKINCAVCDLPAKSLIKQEKRPSIFIY